MKITLCSIVLAILALNLATEAVQVQEEEFSFSLEAVKKLQELTGSSRRMEKLNPRHRTSAMSVCVNPLLPQVFLPLCQQPGAALSLSKLAMIPIDVCEICSFAACTGC
ncbi:guanylin family protein [Lampris incognitus]|uniref:guanylin family protein n=1 Tax=Lampris incognitus TaxID=2546036 RepID=UPI0024B5A84E|nr:guanylin family protein [Lampris incognitus]